MLANTLTSSKRIWTARVTCWHETPWFYEIHCELCSMRYSKKLHDYMIFMWYCFECAFLTLSRPLTFPDNPDIVICVDTLLTCSHSSSCSIIHPPFTLPSSSCLVAHGSFSSFWPFNRLVASMHVVSSMSRKLTHAYCFVISCLWKGTIYVSHWMDASYIVSTCAHVFRPFYAFWISFVMRMLCRNGIAI